MAGTVRVAGLQMHESHAVGENEAKILDALERARGDGAHFLLTP
jgi:hypothetical protein